MTTTETGTRAPEVTPVAEAFLTAVTSRDFPAARDLLADTLPVRMLTPGGLMTERDGDAAIRRFEGWFATGDPFQVLATSAEQVADRAVIGYRIRLRWPEGWHLIAQHLVLAVSGSWITGIDLLCSGFRRVPDPDTDQGPDTGTVQDPDTGTVHTFDAGTLGCADGLAAEFRRQVEAIAVGDVLAVTTRDPAAKEDLPPLARMMGHVVRSIEAADDGRLLICVQRGR